MPSPITHIVLADKVYDEYFSRFDKRQFFFGTSLPDIRYVAGLDRKATHHSDWRIGDGDTPFSAGVKLHLMVDLIFDQFMKQFDIFDFSKRDDPMIRVFKLFQDEMLYGKVGYWPEIAEWMRSVPYDEIDSGLTDRDSVDKWYGALGDYFASGPDNDSRRKLSAVVIAGADTDKANAMVGKMKSDDGLVGIAEAFYERFDALLREMVTANN